MKAGAHVKEELLGLKKAAHGGEVWRYFQKDFVDFSSNVNPLGPSERAMDAVRDALWKCAYYPDPDSRELKGAIGEYMELEEGNITVGNGSTELIKNFVEAFVRRGERIAILGPTFSEYEVFGRLYGAEISFHQAPREEEFRFDDIQVEDGTRALFICNPNNPTGKALGRKRLEGLIEEAGDKECFVFLDEAYIEFTGLRSFCRMATECENLFVLRSLTKFFSLPGMRVGFGVGNEEMIDYLERLRIPWNINILAQTAAIESMKDTEYQGRVKRFIDEERAFFYRGMRGLGLETHASEANFYLTDLTKNGITAPELKGDLIKKNILIRDCSTFTGLDGRYMRTSVRTREENLRLFEELKARLEV